MKYVLSFVAATAVLFGQAAVDGRGLVDRVQNDLRRAERIERQHGKEVARYENAQRHLSDFDRSLVRGRFDKGKLSASIDDVKNVVDHNTLDPENRDALISDLSDLRRLRADGRMF